MCDLWPPMRVAASDTWPTQAEVGRTHQAKTQVQPHNNSAPPNPRHNTTHRFRNFHLQACGYGVASDVLEVPAARFRGSGEHNTSRHRHGPFPLPTASCTEQT